MYQWVVVPAFPDSHIQSPQRTFCGQALGYIIIHYFLGTGIRYQCQITIPLSAANMRNCFEMNKK
jgi:hypothetical protein